MRRRTRKEDKELYSLIPGSEDSKLATRQVEVEERWFGDGGRCERCGLYFITATQRMEVPCVSHPGQYICSGYGFTCKLSLGSWNCCGNKDQEAAGCLVLNEHKQCSKTQEALKTINLGLGSNLGSSLITTSSDTGIDTVQDFPVVSPEISGIGRSEVEERSGYVRHFFKAGETLPGLALMYNVSVQDIKRSNGIISSLLDPGYKSLWIPLPNTTPQPGLSTHGVSKLRALATAEGLQVNQAEASYYLDEEGGDVTKALAALKADIEWERKNSGQN